MSIFKFEFWLSLVLKRLNIFLVPYFINTEREREYFYFIQNLIYHYLYISSNDYHYGIIRWLSCKNCCKTTKDKSFVRTRKMRFLFLFVQRQSIPHQLTCFIFRILFTFVVVCLAIWAAKLRRCVTTKPHTWHFAPLPHSFKWPFNRDIVLYLTPHLVQINRGHPSVSIIIAGAGSLNFPIKSKFSIFN